MLISHKLQFIFVKTRKSAGTSVEISLSRYCDGPEDVITPVLKRETPVQKLAGVYPRNFHDGESVPRFTGHMPATRIRNIVGQDIWSRYTTACIVRNPWSRAVSQYFFRLHNFKTTRQSFDQFIRETDFTVELPMYSQGGEQLVNHVLRYEHLDEDLEVLAESLGIEWDRWLPRSNSGFRPEGKHYSEFYTPETWEIIRSKCAQEIALHGYSFSRTGENGFSNSKTRSESPVYRSPSFTWRASSNLLEDNTCKPVLKEEFKLDRRGGNLILRSTPGQSAYQPGESALEVLSLCDGQRSVEEIFLHLKAKHDVADGELSADILIILDQLKRGGVIDASNLTTNASAGRLKIDLRKIPFLVINCEDDIKRRRFMEAQLRDRGLHYEFVPGVRANPKKLGVARSHLNALSGRDDGKPFVVLEDDCKFTDEFRYEFDLPGDTDAFYLGTSLFGNTHPGTLSRARFNFVRLIPIETEFVRVFNMYARHAILYISDRFRRAAIEAVTEGFKLNGDSYPGDAYYAMLHASHSILAPKKSLCKQYKPMGGAEGATSKALGELL